MRKKVYNPEITIHIPNIGFISEAEALESGIVLDPANNERYYAISESINQTSLEYREALTARRKQEYRKKKLAELDEQISALQMQKAEI